MDKLEITEHRRRLLRHEIARQGLSTVAKLAQKPDRQINDMAAGRKSFGDGMAREIGPRIRPDLPRDWMIYPDMVAINGDTTTYIELKEVSGDSSAAPFCTPRIQALCNKLIEQQDNLELIELIENALRILERKTPASATPNKKNQITTSIPGVMPEHDLDAETQKVRIKKRSNG